MPRVISYQIPKVGIGILVQLVVLTIIPRALSKIASTVSKNQNLGDKWGICPLMVLLAVLLLCFSIGMTIGAGA